MGIGAAIGGIGSALIGASSAKKAAKSQERAAANQLAVEKQMYDETVERFEPFLQYGLTANNALGFELGLGPRPTIGGVAPEVVSFSDTPEWTPPPPRGGGSEGSNEHLYRPPSPVTRYRVNDQVFNDQAAAQAYADANQTGGTEYQGFKATPGYDFRLSQGVAALDNSAASRGNLYSGATLKAQQRFGDNLGAQEYGNYYNRLAGMAASGQAAAGNQANASANYASGAGQAYAGMGNAQAAGAIGVGNALNAGINNTIGIWNYQKQQAAGQNALGGFGGGGFGGIGIGGLY